MATTRTRILAVICAGICGVTTAALANTRFEPTSLADTAHANPDQILHFIVRGSQAGLLAAKSKAAVSSPADAPQDLPLINGVFLQLKESDAEILEARSDITQVYYLPSELAGTYFHVIEGLNYALKNVPAPGVVNMSLGPDPGLMPLASDPDEPMNAATRLLADRGLVVVMAIGNYYDPADPNPGITNPWCRVQWVVCVGAARSDAKVLFDGSARGASNDPASWPDVVANGVDVLSTWPSTVPKSPIQIQQDQASPAWRALPQEQRNQWAVMSGTSQAAAQVSRAASQVIYFFRQAIIARRNAKFGSPIFTIEIPRDRFEYTARRGPRLTGDVSYPSKDTVKVTYRLDQPWKVVKQILMDTALPMPEFPPEAVGAGFVSPDYVDAQFGQFGVGKPGILPVKVL